MRKEFHKLELLVDHLIPWLLLLLFVIIVVDIGYPTIAEKYHSYLQIADAFIIIVFVLDLIFKYIRIRNIKNFLKTCWLDILAVFPFFLVFRVIERFVLIFSISKDLQQAQALLHESLEIEKSGTRLLEESSKIVEEAEKVGKVSRVRQIIRFFRPIERSPRLIRALPFFEHPTGEHYAHEQKEKLNAKNIKRAEKQQ